MKDELMWIRVVLQHSLYTGEKKKLMDAPWKIKSCEGKEDVRTWSRYEDDGESGDGGDGGDGDGKREGARNRGTGKEGLEWEMKGVKEREKMNQK